MNSANSLKEKRWPVVWFAPALLWLIGAAPFVNGDESREARQVLELLASKQSEVSVQGEWVQFDGAQLLSESTDDLDAERTGSSNVALDPTPGDPNLVAGTTSQRTTRPEGLLVAFPINGLLQASAWYGFKPCAPREIAGRPGVCTRVEPKDVHRLGYTLWVDVEQGALLGLVVHDPVGVPLEHMQFSRMSVVGSSGRAHTQPHSDASLPEGVELPRWLPDGFTLRSSDLTERERMMRFSDGVTSFSVFVTRLPEPSTATGESARGASVVVDRIVRGGDGRDYLATIAGEIPLATARRMLLGIQPSS